MKPVLHWFVAFVVIAVCVAAGLIVRKRFFAGKQQLGAGVVIGAGALGTAIAVAILHALLGGTEAPRRDDVLGGLCKTPRAGDEAAQAFHELACSGDVRVADLRGANEYQGVWVHLATRGDKLAVFAPRPGAVAALPTGKAYHLWLLDAAGSVVEHTRLDRTMSTLVIKRPELVKAVKAVITIDGPTAQEPGGTNVVQGAIAPI